MSKLISAILLIAFLSACGGGGGGGSPPTIPVPGIGGAPSPTVAPSPTIITGSSEAYLPLSKGSIWSFDHGKILDNGQWMLDCNCGYNGGIIDELQVSNSSGYQGSIYVAQLQCAFSGTNAPPPTACYTIVGTSTQPAGPDCNQCVTVTSDGAFPHGYPFMDDNPINGEFWGDSLFLSTISAVGATLALPNNQEAINVATDTFSARGLPGNLIWKFSKGVGFVYIQYNGTSAYLTSFTPSAVTSTMLQARRILTARRGQINLAFLKAL